MLESLFIIIYAMCTLNTTPLTVESGEDSETEQVSSTDSDGILEIVFTEGGG